MRSPIAPLVPNTTWVRDATARLPEIYRSHKEIRMVLTRNERHPQCAIVAWLQDWFQEQ